MGTGKKLAVTLGAFVLTLGAVVGVAVLVTGGDVGTLLHPREGKAAPSAEAIANDPTLAPDAARPSAATPGQTPAHPAHPTPAHPAHPATHAATAGGHAATAARPHPRPPHPPADAAHDAPRSHASAPSHATGSLLVTCKPGCTLVVDGHAEGRSPPLRAITLPVGDHRLVATSGKRKAKRRFLVAPGRTTTLHFDLSSHAPHSFPQMTGTESW